MTNGAAPTMTNPKMMTKARFTVIGYFGGTRGRLIWGGECQWQI